MRVAVISDIHANLHALEAVLEAIEQRAPDAIWCLGDLVGYGPQPDECCAVVAGAARRSAWPATTTSACSARSTLDDFSPDAAAAALWTRGVLGEPARAFLGGLGPSSRGARASASSTAARATRSGSTCSAGEAARRRDRGDVGPRRTSSATATCPLAIPRRRRCRTAATPRAARRSTLDGRALAAQPGLGRPAARRRPASGLAPARSRRGPAPSFRRASTTRSQRHEAEIREARPPRRDRWASGCRSGAYGSLSAPAVLRLRAPASSAGSGCAACGCSAAAEARCPRGRARAATSSRAL